MARIPRPVNPDDGPIQAFAHDLRVLREGAGNPTYRVLAKTAGFSATTLGDAAGGVRLPTLEVTLAYVGACGGDADSWRERWRALDRQLAAESDPAKSADGQPAPAEAPQAQSQSQVQQSQVQQPQVQQAQVQQAQIQPAEETEVLESEVLDASPARRWDGRSWPRRSALAATAALAVTIGLIIWRLPALGTTATPVAHHTSAAPVAAAATCPASTGGTGAAGSFTGITYFPTTNVRAGASQNAPIISSIPPKCDIAITGYCLGDVIQDSYGGSPDMRWFILSRGGVVASAVIHGNPPASMQPTSCPDDVPPPTAITLSLAPGSTGAGVVGLQASGTGLWIAGFAAYYPAATGQPAMWQHVGMTSQPGFTVMLRAGLPSGAPSSAGIPVIAVACLGGNGPTDVASTGVLEPSTPAALQPSTITGNDLTTAEQAACHYPAVD